MKAVVFCAALASFAVAPAFAQDLIARQGDDSVRLSDDSCKSKLVLSRLEPGLAGEFKAPRPCSRASASRPAGA